jgi:hypothetical protein
MKKAIEKTGKKTGKIKRPTTTKIKSKFWVEQPLKKCHSLFNAEKRNQEMKHIGPIPVATNNVTAKHEQHMQSK